MAQLQTAAWAERVSSSDVFRALDTLKARVAPPLVMPRQTLFLSATWASAVSDISRLFVSDDVVEFRIQPPPPPSSKGPGGTMSCTATDLPAATASGDGRGAMTSGVLQKVEVFAQHADKLPALSAALVEHGAVGGCLVFVKTKSRCDWLVKKLLLLQQQAAGGGPPHRQRGGRGGGGGSGDGAVATTVEPPPPPPPPPVCRWIRAIHSGLTQPVREQTLRGYRDRVQSGASASASHPSIQPASHPAIQPASQPASQPSSHPTARARFMILALRCIVLRCIVLYRK
eukprot:COSAG01_NODE_4046_length_5403_cov_7.683446_4_plen_286_part_00